MNKMKLLKRMALRNHRADNQVPGNQGQVDPVTGIFNYQPTWRGTGKNEVGLPGKGRFPMIGKSDGIQRLVTGNCPVDIKRAVNEFHRRARPCQNPIRDTPGIRYHGAIASRPLNRVLIIGHFIKHDIAHLWPARNSPE